MSTTPSVFPPVLPPVSKPPELTESFTFNSAKVSEKLKAIKAHLNGFVGKPGYNAFAYLHKHVKPLEVRLDNGETSKELFDAFMALPNEPEPIAKGAEHNAKEAPAQAQAAGASDKRILDEKIINPGIKTTI